MTDANVQPKLSVSPENFNIFPTSAAESCLQITNVSFVPILYRALSTAPKQFQVRPRQGVIESGKSETIVITYSNNKDEDSNTSVDRKEEFKIEYTRMTEENRIAIANAGGNASIVTDLIKAAQKADKKSKVVTCVITGTPKPAAPVAAAVAPAPAADPAPAVEKKAAPVAVAAEKKPELPPAVARASEREATTDALTADAGLRSRASAAAPSAAAASARPSAAATPAVGLPAKKEAVAAKPQPVAFAADPIGFLKQNPIVAAGIVIGLYLIAKLLL